MITAASLTHPKSRHSFFTREGGVSQGIYGSLNCGLGSADDPDAVRENRRRAAEKLGVAANHLVTLYQVHSDRVITLERPWDKDERPQADALVTKTPGIALGVLSADCLPVLFQDAEAGVIGAAHAGWKGALGGVLEATLTAMEALGAQRELLRAAIGPAIQQSSYEVSEGFEVPFLARDEAAERFFRPGRPGKLHFDLPGYAAWRLASAGLREVELLGHDTCSDPARFFSYRRTTLEAATTGTKDYGRLLSAIALNA